MFKGILGRNMATKRSSHCEHYDTQTHIPHTRTLNRRHILLNNIRIKKTNDIKNEFFFKITYVTI